MQVILFFAVGASVYADAYSGGCLTVLVPVSVILLSVLVV